MEEDLNKEKDVLCSWIGRQYCEVVNNTQSDLQIQHNLC